MQAKGKVHLKLMGTFSGEVTLLLSFLPSPSVGVQSYRREFTLLEVKCSLKSNLLEGISSGKQTGN